MLNSYRRLILDASNAAIKIFVMFVGYVILTAMSYFFEMQKFEIIFANIVIVYNVLVAWQLKKAINNHYAKYGQMVIAKDDSK